MYPIKVRKRRTTRVSLKLPYDVSNDTFVSEIRAEIDPESDLIAAWTFSFATDGTDGELVMTIDNSVSQDITQSKGWMDIKRVTGGEPMDVFEDPLEVLFVDPVTA